jgi:hypothetical protein
MVKRIIIVIFSLYHFVNELAYRFPQLIIQIVIILFHINIIRCIRKLVFQILLFKLCAGGPILEILTASNNDDCFFCQYRK